MATSAPTATATPETLDTPGREMARKLTVEAIGTFFLVFAVGSAVHSGNTLAPLAIGATLMVMVYAGGHISGGHYNPAVTLAALVRGRITPIMAACYWIAQVTAGLLAALIVRLIVGAAKGSALNPSGRLLADALTAEFLFTFALAYVVLNVATSKDHPDNSFYGLAIGFTVAAGAIAVGNISGGAFNPAVLFGGMVMGLFGASTLLYLIVQLLAGAAAGLAFRMLNRADA